MEDKQDKVIKVRVTKRLLTFLHHQATLMHMSLSGYINFILNSFTKKPLITFEETVIKPEKKDIQIRVNLTPSEMSLVRQHAFHNNWSAIKEIRYRLISSLAKKPKLNQEELRAIYAVRSSLNVLGANINRLVRNSEPLSEDHRHLCQELMKLLKEIKDQITYLEHCGQSNFKLKEVADERFR